jgi:HNH endonuclease
MDETLAQEVRRRAGDACEYCGIPQRYYPTVVFPVDHIIARQHGGPTAPGNLALSCLHAIVTKGQTSPASTLIPRS